MNARKNSQDSRRARAKKATTRGISGDQNSVTGRVENGGIVFQGGEHGKIEIHQNFAAPTASVVVENHLRSPTIPTEYFEPETIYIPEGPFWMGCDSGEGIPTYETPRHEVTLLYYRIGKYPVTNTQYEVFIHETGRLAPQGSGWEGQRVREGMENCPVTGVTWHETLAYCEWLSGKTGRHYILPNEAQWEKACRGGGECKYPWGDEFDPARSNHGNSLIAPVDAYIAQNDYGLFDLVGNVRQWTTTLWGKKLIVPDPVYAYPWRPDQRNDLGASRQLRRVVRGASFAEDVRCLRCSTRGGQVPDDAGWVGAGISFRVAMKV